MPNTASILPQPRDLGVLAYGPALDLQRSLNQAVIDQLQPPVVLLVEHEPVLTLTPRKSAKMNLRASPEQLAAAGVTTHETDRGGDVTYHGPGQLVVYPILKLSDYGLNLSKYMRLLEQVVIDTLAVWGITGVREEGATGVWVGGSGGRSKDQVGMETDGYQGLACAALPPVAELAKVCAMGVRIRKNTTMHGLALNVAPDMSHFELIVPCGLADRPVVSLKQLLGDACPSMDEVKQVLVGMLHANLLRSASEQGPGTTAGSPPLPR